MKNLSKTVFICLLLVTVTSCSNSRELSKTTPTNRIAAKATPTYQFVQIPQTLHKIELIEEGMSKEQIKSVLGQPDSIEDMCCSKDKPKKWSYHGIKCFQNEERPNVKSTFRGECEVHIDKETNKVVGWDKKNSQVIVTQQQCVAHCN